ncbi:MAG: hypothetical protein ACRDKT_09660 [Actinomycetota bacterium]
MRPIRVVPHFHWDREWYLSFEEFRAQLVDAMDLLLDIFERDDRWTHFHLDGQIALIDDYLEVRPERESDLRAHIASGRLSCGPWVTLVDEFLVSGESVIRNLEDGIARAKELGDVMTVAYLPDQFGHVGQMPQLLREAGFDRVVVWRGVPEEITETAFTWGAPDGSSIEAIYLPFGYGNGRRVMRDPDRAAGHVQDALAALDPFLADDEVAVLMAGNDHLPPSPSLTDALGSLQRDGMDITMSSLPDAVATRPGPTQSFIGELRSAARANLLPNTYSVRINQKLARGRAEHLLERYAEPLAALVPGYEWPEERLREAWRLLHLNGAHDSVCGCSTDAVAHAVDERTERVAGIARTIAQEALCRLALVVAEDGPVVFNPSPFERAGVPGLGWGVKDDLGAAPRPVPLQVVDYDAVAVAGEAEFHFTLEDQGDEGDLYNFCPAGPVRPPNAIGVHDGAVRFSFDGCDATVSAASTDEGFVRLSVTIDNRAPDHRLRLVLLLPETPETSVAASTFELVRRPLASEGGINEPPSPCWPARGIAVAGDRGFLFEGVFEYELTGTALAMTLLRCTGTISRADLSTRRGVAGPDVATPEAQMIGTHNLQLGLVYAPDDRVLLERWERYALPLLAEIVAGGEEAEGGGELPSTGALLDVDVPALSSIRRRNGNVAVTVWNPFDDERPANLGGVAASLGPHRVETFAASSGIADLLR